MQIVIDISDSIYNYIHNEHIAMRVCDSHKVAQAIANGKVLPEGHGRIADMDEAIKCIKDCEGDDAIWAISLIEWACGKRTIIEADKAESEEV